MSETPFLTILYHFDHARVGERASLRAVRELRRAVLNRALPLFVDDEERSRPLASEYVTSKEIVIEPSGDGLVLSVPEGVHLRVDGEKVSRSELTSAQITDGVVLDIGGAVVLLLHYLDDARGPARGETLGILGRSDAIQIVREAILRCAPSSVPVLIRGETGTGKELVARAVHGASARRGCVYAVANAAEHRDPTFMTAHLFGQLEGSHSGAFADTDGVFGEAQGGTLFLDEIGELQVSVQPILYRAIEYGQAARFGASQPRPIDVRLITATDLPLEEAILEGRFRQQLHQRIAGAVIRIPALRERREDVAHLLYHFLREFMAGAGIGAELLEGRPAGRPPWLSSRLLAQMVRYDWPGNVRQLRNVAHHLVLRHGRSDVVNYKTDPELAFARGRAQRTPDPAPKKALTDPQWLSAYKVERYVLAALAERMGCPPGTARDRIQAILEKEGVMTAAQCSREQLEAVGEACGWKVQAMEERLWSPRRAIQLALTRTRLDAGRLIMD